MGLDIPARNNDDAAPMQARNGKGGSSQVCQVSPRILRYKILSSLPHQRPVNEEIDVHTPSTPPHGRPFRSTTPFRLHLHPPGNVVRPCQYQSRLTKFSTILHQLLSSKNFLSTVTHLPLRLHLCQNRELSRRSRPRRYPLPWTRQSARRILSSS